MSPPSPEFSASCSSVGDETQNSPPPSVKLKCRTPHWLSNPPNPQALHINIATQIKRKVWVTLLLYYHWAIFSDLGLVMWQKINTLLYNFTTTFQCYTAGFTNTTCVYCVPHALKWYTLYFNSENLSWIKTPIYICIWCDLHGFLTLTRLSHPFN
jgi:hypothetical protein